MPQSFRKAIRVLHLWLALASGLVIFVVALTGGIYCFESELRGFFHPELYDVQKTGGPKKPVSVMLEHVNAEFPKQKVRFVNLPADPGKSAVFALKNKTSVFVNPYTGLVVGSLEVEKDFFGVVLQLHRSLLLGDAGKSIIGISALVFLVMIISGIILWWPRNRVALRWKFLIKKETRVARRTYDLHSILGFYASWILLISVTTGLIFSFKWAERSMYWLTGSVKNEMKPASVFQPGPSLPADKIASAITARYPSNDLSLFFPDDSVGVYRAGIDLNKGGVVVKKDFYFFDRYTGKLVELRLSRFSSTGEKLRASNYNLHTGKSFGLIGQILMFCAALTAASLPVSGFLIWRNRLKKNKTDSNKKKRLISSLEYSER